MGSIASTIALLWFFAPWVWVITRILVLAIIFQKYGKREKQ